MAWLSTALSVAGTALSIYSDYKGSQKQQEAAQRNVRSYEAEVEYQREKTADELRQLKDYKDRLISRQRVMFAKAGVQVDDNAALDVVIDSARQYEIDKAVLLRRGELNERRAREGADLYREEARDAKTLGLLSMGQTFLQSPLLNR